jgi:hypothetical protein
MIRIAITPAAFEAIAFRREQCRRVRHALTRNAEQRTLPDGANHRADGEAPECNSASLFDPQSASKFDPG